MDKTLLDLEQSFFKIQYISDKEWLDTTLHDDFTECGKSGILFDKYETMESLLSCAEDRDIEIFDFECRNISGTSWLVHYITKSGNKRYYRTSVWVKEKQLKLFYHQATLLNDNNVEIY